MSDTTMPQPLDAETGGELFESLAATHAALRTRLNDCGGIADEVGRMQKSLQGLYQSVDRLTGADGERVDASDVTSEADDIERVVDDLGSWQRDAFEPLESAATDAVSEMRSAVIALLPTVSPERRVRWWRSECRESRRDAVEILGRLDATALGLVTMADLTPFLPAYGGELLGRMGRAGWARPDLRGAVLATLLGDERGRAELARAVVRQDLGVEALARAAGDEREGARLWIELLGMGLGATTGGWEWLRVPDRLASLPERCRALLPASAVARLLAGAIVGAPPRGQAPALSRLQLVLGRGWPAPVLAALWGELVAQVPGDTLAHWVLSLGEREVALDGAPATIMLPLLQDPDRGVRERAGRVLARLRGGTVPEVGAAAPVPAGRGMGR